MKIFVTAKPNRKEEKVKKISENVFEVWVKEPPQEGRANEAIIGVLSKYFGIPKSQVKMISGHKSRQKVFEV
jgi:uncharacterized protein (TIGR00251 family)